MGIWASLSRLAADPFNYRPGPSTLGVGVSNLALEQPGRAVDQDFNSPRYNVRNGMTIGFPTYELMGQLLPSYDLRANGVYLSGDIALQQLLYQERV